MSPEEIVANEWRRVLGETITEDLVTRLVFDALAALEREHWSIVQLRHPTRPVYEVEAGTIVPTRP